MKKVFLLIKKIRRLVVSIVDVRKEVHISYMNYSTLDASRRIKLRPHGFSKTFVNTTNES